jgi:hypothetical protein
MRSTRAPAGSVLRHAGIDPTAPRPPFRFEVDIPEPWIVPDLDPRRSAGWIRQFVERSGTDGAWSSPDRRAAAQLIRSVVATLRAQGVLLAAILAGRVGPEVVGASVTLGWRRLPDQVDLDALGSLLARMEPGECELVDRRLVDLLVLSSGRAIRLRSLERARVPGSTGEREVAVHQLFVPIDPTSWTAIVTATTASPELRERVRLIAIHVADSIRTGTIGCPQGGDAVAVGTGG